jgi:hypothetical protein
MLRLVLVYYHVFLTLLVQCTFVLVREWPCTFTILGDIKLRIDELMSTIAYRLIKYAGAQHPLSNGTNLLQVFADSNYAGDETRRSNMGTVTIMNGGPISWSSVLS